MTPRGPATRVSALAGLALGVLAACGQPGPRALGYGQEPCTHCHMILEDPRFAAQLVSSTGKTFPFDDVGCLTAYLAVGGPGTGPDARAWVNDFVDPGTTLRADSAVYLRSDTLRTPMSSHLAALRPGREADSVRAALGGTLLGWRELLRESGS